MWKRFYFKSFEVFVGVFVIVNGILTIFPGSVVRENLQNIIGLAGPVIPIFQVLAGSLKLIGLGINRSNIEAAGLIMVASLFLIRGLALVCDGDVTLSDINNLTIAVGIIFSNITRLSQLVNSHKYLVTTLDSSVPIKGNQ